MRPADLDQEELLMMLQDTVTTVAAGRTDGNRCPVCERGDLACENEDGWVKVACAQCGLKFEAMIG